MNTSILTSVVTSLLMAAIGGVAAKLGWDSMTTTTVVGAAATIIVAVLVTAWKAAQHSNNAVIAAAAKAIEPTGGVIQTTPDVANGPLASVPNVVTKP